MARIETAHYYSSADIRRIEQKAVKQYRKERKETLKMAIAIIAIFALILLCCLKVLMFGY